MRACIHNSCLSGTLDAVPSKSFAHRALILSSLASGPSTLTLGNISEDIEATISCLRALGAKFTLENNVCKVSPIDSDQLQAAKNKVIELNCGESGSTLRFMLVLASALGTPARFVGRGKLLERPHSKLLNLLKDSGVDVKQTTDTITLEGSLTASDITLEGNISSQFISAFMLASPVLERRLTIHVKKPIESLPYIVMTGKALSDFGLQAEFIEHDDELEINCKSEKLQARNNYVVEGDWSQAAFWIVAGCQSTGGICVRGLSTSSTQGDAHVIDYLKAMGADMSSGRAGIKTQNSQLMATSIDVSDCPDLVPALCIAAAHAHGTTRFVGASRLRIKESDRLQAVVDALLQLGIDACASEDELTVGSISGRPSPVIEVAKDHRIVMMAAILAAQLGEKTYITNSESVNKSYPTFFDDLRLLGCLCSEED